MAMVPREALDDLVASLDGLSEATRRVIRRLLMGITWTDVEDLREQVLRILSPILDAATLDAAALSCDFYDTVREYSIGERLGARPAPGRNAAATEEVVRSLAGRAPAKGMNWFVEQMLLRADWEIRAASNRSIAENGARDPAEKRWARIPRSADPCWFCCMIASHGFYYRSADTAMRTHSHCKCTVAPGFDGATEIEGYDPDHYYALFDKALTDGVVTYDRLSEMSAKAKRRHRLEDVTDAQRNRYRELRQIRRNLADGLSTNFRAPLPSGDGNGLYSIPPYAIGDASFSERLGYRDSNADELVMEAMRRSNGHSFRSVDPEHGIYRQNVRMAGPNGRKARVDLTWSDTGHGMTLVDAKVGRYI